MISGLLWVQFSCSVVSNSLPPHESQDARPPCPSPTPGVHSDSRPSSLWCHPAISSSVVPFSSWPQSFQAPVFSNESTAWRAAIHGVAKSRTQLSDWTELNRTELLPQLCPKNVYFSFAALQVDHQHYLSRFHIYVLIYHICLSLSDLLHAV